MLAIQEGTSRTRRVFPGSRAWPPVVFLQASTYSLEIGSK